MDATALSHFDFSHTCNEICMNAEESPNMVAAYYYCRMEEDLSTSIKGWRIYFVLCAKLMMD